VLKHPPKLFAIFLVSQLCLFVQQNIFRLRLLNIGVCMKVLATLPVSTATAEQTFSTLKRLKTYLRNATGQDRLRLTGLALMSVHRDIDVNVQRVIDELSKKPRRLNFVL